MINKSTFSILMAVLFFVNSSRAMEDPSQDRGSEQVAQEQDSKESKSSKTTTCSLKDIIVKRVGLKALCILSPKIFPEELREYGIQFLINEHCAPLEKFKENKEYAYLKVTEENLNNYKKLLYGLCENQVEVGCLALAEFGKCWPDIFRYMALYDICEFLKILTKQSNGFDITLSDNELLFRDKVLHYILNNKNVELFKLLLNKGLLPRLDYKINISNNDVCRFLRRLISSGSSYFFETILQKEKNKDYNWKELFDQEEGRIMGGMALMPNVMLTAADFFEKNIFKAILALAKEKESLDINVRDPRKGADGYTILMVAVYFFNVELVELVLENGADINIKSNSGRTALDYAKAYLDQINLELDRVNLVNGEVKLFEERRLSLCEIIRILIEYGAVPNLAVNE